MNLEAPPKVEIAYLPTPVHKLERLTAELAGPELWVKRDDLTGHAFGGNKIRKLEYLIADAQAAGSDTLVTAGAVQSNHCRQTAGAAARFGLDCVLVLEGPAPAKRTGNVLLDLLFGAELLWTEDSDLQEALQSAFDSLVEAGKRPYLIPIGGSNPIGSAGYIDALEELLGQQVDLDRIVVSLTSGGTLAGLLAGAHMFDFSGEITAIRISHYEQSTPEILADHAAKAAARFGREIQLDPAEFDIREDYLTPGYAVLTGLEREAIRDFARLEGVLLDPVYTARAAGGMMDLIRKGAFDSNERILFWHTGGAPALFAYGDELLL